MPRQQFPGAVLLWVAQKTLQGGCSSSHTCLNERELLDDLEKPKAKRIASIGSVENATIICYAIVEISVSPS
eukprot:1196276-Prorocentrum_minimum.AAC.4